jgi:hypothetical protein
LRTEQSRFEETFLDQKAFCLAKGLRQSIASGISRSEQPNRPPLSSVSGGNSQDGRKPISEELRHHHRRCDRTTMMKGDDRGQSANAGIVPILGKERFGRPADVVRQLEGDEGKDADARLEQSQQRDLGRLVTCAGNARYGERIPGRSMGTRALSNMLFCRSWRSS